MNINHVNFESAAGNASQLPASIKPEVVFSGRSNVGKSSLINRILNRKAIARVSSTPGKTATINFFAVDRFYMVDLPGYGYAKVSKNEKRRWSELVEGYFSQSRKISLVIQIVDLRHPPTSDDMQMIRFLHTSGLPFIIVLTKQDKLNKTRLAQRLSSIREELAGFEEIQTFPFSALNGEGVEEIRNIIDVYVDRTIEAEEL